MIDNEADSTPDEGQAGEGLDAILDSAIAEAFEAEDAPVGKAEPAKDAEDAEAEDEPVEAAEAADEGDEEDTTEDEAEEAEEEPAPVSTIEAPQDWPADQREKFAALDDAGKNLVLEQYKNFQAGFTRKSQELSEKARLADRVQQEFAPYRQQLALRGMDEAAGMRFLLAAHDKYTRDPVGYLHMAAQQAGIDLRALVAEQGEPEYIDPQVMTLQQRQAALEQYIQRQQISQQQAAYNATISHVQSFAEAKDEAGNPLRPHFERVSGTMTALIQANPGMTLEQAYQRAVGADPDLFSEAVKAAEERARKEAEAKRQTAVEKARKAGSRRVSGSPPGKGEARPKSLDAILRQSMDAAGIG